MMFGALSSCPLCSGSLRYSAGMYRCQGYLSEWSKCSFSTLEPERIKRKWKIPEDTDNQYLIKVTHYFSRHAYLGYETMTKGLPNWLQWFKSQKVGKRPRILPPMSVSSPNGSRASQSGSQSSNSESLADLKVAISGLPKETIVRYSFLCCIFTCTFLVCAELTICFQ